MKNLLIAAIVGVLSLSFGAKNRQPLPLTKK
jgi:hypothetical protein